MLGYDHRQLLEALIGAVPAVRGEGFRVPVPSGLFFAIARPPTTPRLYPRLLGREPINLEGVRLARVRYAPIATKFRSAGKRRDGPHGASVMHERSALSRSSIVGRKGATTAMLISRRVRPAQSRCHRRTGKCCSWAKPATPVIPICSGASDSKDSFGLISGDFPAFPGCPLCDAS